VRAIRERITFDSSRRIDIDTATSMRRRKARRQFMKFFDFQFAVSLVGLAIIGSSMQAQQAAPSLQDLLANEYKVSKTGTDATGFKVITPGTAVAVKQAGVMATAQGTPHMIAFKLPKVCDNTFKNGKLTVPKACASTSVGSHYLNDGEMLLITKFEVNEKSNKISFNLVECDACNRVPKPSAMKVAIVFEFAPRFLDTAEPGQVTDVINQVFQPVKPRK